MVIEQEVIDQLIQEAEDDHGHRRMLRMDHGDFTLVEWLKYRPIRESREGRWEELLERIELDRASLPSSR